MYLVSCSLSGKYSQCVYQISFYCQVLFPIPFWLRAFYCHIGNLNVCSSFVINSRWHLLWFAFIWLLANQVKSFWVILVRRISITSAAFLQQSSCSKDKSHTIMINNITLRSTRYKIFPCSIWEFIFSFAFDSEGNIESFPKQEVIIQRYVVLQLVNHNKYSISLQ